MKKLFLLPSLLLMVLMTITVGCSNNDDPAANNTVLYFSFNQQLESSSFVNGSRPVDIWALDANGNIAWSTRTTTDEIAKTGDNRLFLSIPEGRYDFVVWGGLIEDSPLSLLSASPSNKEDLWVKLALSDDSSFGKVSDKDLPDLFHGYIKDVRIGKATELRSIVIPMMRVTNLVNVIIQGEIDDTSVELGCSFHITKGRDEMSYDSAMPEGKVLTYLPFQSGEYELPPLVDGTRSILGNYFSFSMTRIMADGGYELVIEKDGIEKARYSLVDLLLKKSQNPDEQKYLDQNHSYTLAFHLREDDITPSNFVVE